MVRFTYDEDRKEITINQNERVSKLLDMFLTQTDSVMEKDPQKIVFFYGAKVINSPEYINKTLREMKFKNVTIIKVLDTNGIIGGFFGS